MSQFIFSQFSFYFAILLVCFVPGFFLLLCSKMHKELDLLELFVLTIASSIITTDFLVIILGRSVGITKLSVLFAIILFSAICLGIYIYNQKKHRGSLLFWQEIAIRNLPKRSTILVVLLLFLTIFIKTIYFKDSIFPTATDLGHHMYWTKVITTTGKLPDYAKTNIGTDYAITKPQPIADFIIGEHLFFAALQLISGAEFISAFPILVLLFIHIITLLAVFVLVRAFFRKSQYCDTIAIITLFLIGPLYALSSPQAKFVSGGVIGNDVGNLLIPIAVLLFMKAFQEKKSSILAYALFLSLGMAYTHHLSTFVFIFLAVFTFIAYAILNWRTFLSDFKDWMQMAFTKEVIAVLIMGAIFVFGLYMPTYLNTKAINTAVGAPSKASRAGLTLTQLKQTAGEARFAFAVIGILILLFAKKLGKYNQAFLIGWGVALTMMSLRPDWLFVDIPSNRIASYVVYPAAIIAAYLFVVTLQFLKTSERNKNYLKPQFLLIIFFVFMVFMASNGFYDDAQVINSNKSDTKALQTYAASKYLSEKISTSDMLLKDHNYLSGDSWIKSFFMRGYNFPLSRGYFKRYSDDTKSREQCTNFMISQPNGDEAQKCYAGTKTDFVMIDPKIDSAQFQRINSFWQVYESDAVGIYYKAN